MKLTSTLTQYEPPKSSVPRNPAAQRKTNHLIICAPKHRNPQTSAEH